MDVVLKMHLVMHHAPAWWWRWEGGGKIGCCGNHIAPFTNLANHGPSAQAKTGQV